MSEKTQEDWTLYFTNGDDGPISWHIRNSIPNSLNPTDFPISVIIEWAYDNAGAPNQETLEKLHEFESYLDSLNNIHGNSLLVHIIRGDGISESCYYCRDYSQFMSELNTALANKPRFPIEILHDQDPQWSYWNETKDSLIENDG